MRTALGGCNWNSKTDAPPQTGNTTTTTERYMTVKPIKELTWRDISHLEIILADMVDEDVASKLPDMGDAEYYTEALKRFNEWKEDKR